MNKLIYAIALGVGLMGLSNGAAEAASARTLTLKWAPATQSVSGYEVYYGKTADQAKMRQLPVPLTINAATPSVQFDVLRDLVALPGQNVCFRVKAYDNVSKSALSDAVCTAI